MKKIVFLFMVLLIMLSCNVSDNDKLRIGIISPSLNHLPLNFAFRHKIMDETDYSIKKFSSGWETNEALVAEKIDVAILPFTYIWSDVSQGKKVKIVSFLERESDGIICKKTITNPQALDGKKIGVLRASTLDVFAEMFAEKYRISPELVYFRTPMEMAAALKIGEVDALSYYVPAIFNFSDDFHIMHWYGEDFPKHTCCDIAATERAIANKFELLKTFLSEIEESCDELNLNPSLAFQTAQKDFGLTEKLSRQSLYNTKFIMNLSEKDKQFEQKAVLKMIEKGYIKNKVDPADVYLQIDWK